MMIYFCFIRVIVIVILGLNILIWRRGLIILVRVLFRIFLIRLRIFFILSVCGGVGVGVFIDRCEMDGGFFFMGF